MEVVESIARWRTIRAGLAGPGRTIGFVPTMGALHRGHESLIRRSGHECDATVVSVFVNPAQFDDPGDLAAYPRPLETDRVTSERAGANYLLVPERADIYPDGYRFRVTETDTSRELEGAFRQGHFDGVLTVVLRLFDLVGPDRAYFGEKDWQQYTLVRDLAAAFLLDVEVVPCPIVRDADGVAVSSRNGRLDPPARALAARFAERLARGGPPGEIRLDLERAGVAVQYVAERDGRRLAAVTIGGVRLIDNVPI